MTGAHHARSERQHRHVVRPMIGAQHHHMMALPARHRERPHTPLARCCRGSLAAPPAIVVVCSCRGGYPHDTSSAVGAHVAAGHWRSGLRSSCAEGTASAASSESCRYPPWRNASPVAIDVRQSPDRASHYSFHAHRPGRSFGLRYKLPDNEPGGGRSARLNGGIERCRLRTSP
jgi:hypothetical protein